MKLTETAAVVYRSIVTLGSLAVPARFRFGPNDGIPNMIGTGFVVDARGIVMTAGHVPRALSSLPRHPETGKHAAMATLFRELAQIGDALRFGELYCLIWVLDGGDDVLRLRRLRRPCHRFRAVRHVGSPTTVSSALSNGGRG